MKTKIKTFEDACKLRGIDSSKLPDVSGLPEKHQKALISHYKLIIIAEALNMEESGEEWKPDWSNWDEYKYYPWFDISKNAKNPSGFGFSGTYYVFTDTGTDVGSRLCFRTSELAMYAGKKFKKLYEDYYLMPK